MRLDETMHTVDVVVLTWWDVVRLLFGARLTVPGVIVRREE